MVTRFPVYFLYYIYRLILTIIYILVAKLAGFRELIDISTFISGLLAVVYRVLFHFLVMMVELAFDW